eukprot:TRINITY_DN8919_c0_g1_i3.p1 TRINITY_DN8919_c0_g1~~TRINITY_DN8919_c0_g1_i3.p1  ORF type:complete len:531 (-),score=63.73 TRINITY_DN8919_c0_g1_i3:199-1746(-)
MWKDARMKKQGLLDDSCFILEKEGEEYQPSTLTEWKQLCKSICYDNHSFRMKIYRFCKTCCFGCCARRKSRHRSSCLQRLAAKTLVSTARASACKRFGLKWDDIRLMLDLYAASFNDNKSSARHQLLKEVNVSSLPVMKVLQKKIGAEIPVDIVVGYIVDHIKASSASLLQLSIAYTYQWSPFLVIFHYSMYMPVATCKLLFMCKVFRVCMFNAFFYLNFGSQSAKSGQTCLAEGLWEQIGRSIAVATVSFILGSGPLAVLTMLHARDFKESLPFDKPAHLHKWGQQVRLLWMIASLYIVACALYVLLFLANVRFVDTIPWAFSSAVSIAQQNVLLPLSMGLAFCCLAVVLSSWPTGSQEKWQTVISIAIEIVEGEKEDDRDAVVVGVAPAVYGSAEDVGTDKSMSDHQTDSLISGIQVLVDIQEESGEARDESNEKQRKRSSKKTSMRASKISTLASTQDGVVSQFSTDADSQDLPGKPVGVVSQFSASADSQELVGKAKKKKKSAKATAKKKA